MPKLSVVLPTLNCIGMLPAHLKSMRPWLNLADEIIVVDSFSNDGTPDYIRKNLRHPKLKVLSHPRGLYQSWNFGISQTTGDWIYMSTVGDRITPELLRHLCEVGETLACDVVASRPTFINEDDSPAAPAVWPIDHILKSSGGRRPIRLAGVETLLFALLNIPNALLGSSASNVYRARHLRERPFPTEFGTVGDTGWSLRYGLGTNYGFTPVRGSTFRLHAKAYSKTDYAVENLVAKLADCALEMLHGATHSPETQAGIAKFRLVETARTLAANSRRSAMRDAGEAAAVPTKEARAPGVVQSAPAAPPRPVSRLTPIGPATIVRPRTLNLQAIDVCNSRCIMCNVWKEGRREQLSLDELRAYLQQPFFSEVGHVGVTGGEPTLRKDLVGLYRLLPECLPQLAGASFITHGLQTDRAIDVYSQVHDYYRGLSLSFEGMVSLDGVGAVHDRVRGRQGAFAAATQTLFGLQRRGVKVIAACTIVRSNVYDLHDLLDWGRANRVPVRFRVAEFIRRLHNDSCASEIRSFDPRERRHLVSFLHVLLAEYETDETIRRTYTSILSLLTGGERLMGCPYQKGHAINVDSRGGIACCAPKGTECKMPAGTAEVHALLQAQRADVAQKHCANCIHDYHDDWNETTLAEVGQSQNRARDLYDGSDDALTTPEVAAQPLNLGGMSRILLAGWYGTETAGDIAILQGIISEYLQANPELQFHVLSLYPYYTRTTVEAWPEALQARVGIIDYASAAAWQATLDCDAIVMAGGPLMDIGETRKILCLFKRFADLGKPRVIEGCGIGPLNQPAYRWNVCRIARLATRISVRDRASRDLLRTLGIGKAIDVRRDPAVTFLRALEIRHHGSKAKIIRCFLRELTSEYPQVLTPAEARENLVVLLRRLLTWYPEYRIELWSMHHFPVGYDDRLFARGLVRQIADPRLTCDWEPRSPGEIAAAMAAAEFCVCMRFHSCVFAMEVGVPFLAIDYTAGGKIKGFLDDVRQAHRLCGLSDLRSLEQEQFAARVWNRSGLPAGAAVPAVTPPHAPRVLHVIQSVTGGGGARAMLALAKHSRRFGGPEHSVVSLLPADVTGLDLARQAGVEMMNHPDGEELRHAMAGADIVLVHWWNNPELAALFRRELPPMRLALWLHVGGYHSPQVLTPALIEFADLAVACSPHTHAHPVFAGMAPEIRAQRSAMVLAGADFDRLQGCTPREHLGFQIGYIGTLDPVKMHSDFVAMSCAIRIPDAKFVVCGGGDARWLVEQARKLGRSACFDFRGGVEDIRSVIEEMDVYGYPLCADTYAAAELNLQEVMFAGVPVVAFPHGGIGRLIVHGETGLLVKSPEEYARAIEHLHQNPAERARLGANAAAFARRHWGAENAAREFNAHFESLLVRSKRSRQWGVSFEEPVATAPNLVRELAINPGARLFVESLGEGAEVFLASLTATEFKEGLRIEEQIGRLSRMIRYTGIIAYRNAYPRDPYLQLWAGLVFLHANMAREALGAFDLARRSGFSHVRLWWYWALAAERAGRPDAAVGALRLLMQSEPEFAPARDLERRLLGVSVAPGNSASRTAPTATDQHYVQQAARLLQAGQLAAARDSLERALELKPGQVVVMEALGQLYCRIGNFDAAHRLFDKIARLEPQRKSPGLRALQAALAARPRALQEA